MATSYKSDGDSTVATRVHPPHPQVVVRPYQPRLTRPVLRGLAFGSQIGPAKSGIGFAWKIFRVCRAIQRAELFAFWRRALSVEIPVPAYICR